MESFEEDDDTHFCIKCHSTINGLENYVRHRQSGCRPQETKPSEVTNETSSTPTTVTYPEILNADAFFSSLELQSSTKSNAPSRSRGPVNKERKVGRVEDKGKRKGRRGQEPDDGGLKEKLLNMPPVVADLDDLMDHLGIPSLVGFPDIVTTTKSSVVTSGKSVCTPSSTKLNNHETLSASPVESIIANSKSCNERKRSDEPQRMEQDHGEWLDDTMLVDLDTNSENKEPDHGELTSYADYDYQQDEESNGDSGEDDIDENDSYSNDDETEDREFSPRGHTGGKWKPSELLQDMSRLNEEEFIEDEDNAEHPPPSHTGGKWKPADSSQRVDENELAGKDPGASSLGLSSTTTGRQPPPGHTRGKWIPGASGDFGSGYWCDPCGRKLASRLLYNRHLLSDLHARRSIQEIDGDLQLPRGVGPLLRRKSASKRQRALAEIKSRTKNQSQHDDTETRKRTRRRQKEVLVCEMCQARVRRPQMGKHLLSHYHCRVAGTNPCSSPKARRFILENMSNVVRQCPFQCSICRFYCNTETTFLRHWRSTLHTSKSDDVGGSYKCSPCNFDCNENERMEEHLTSSGHREVVAMMNGSVPVVVGRQRYLSCETCNQRFRYNIQLRIHARETGHSGNVTATDEYQSRIACGECSQVVKSLVALQRHQLSCHARKTEIKDDEAKIIAQPAAPYFCSFCMMNFMTAHEAVLHRRTSSHKEIVRAQKFNAENLSSLSRDCPHCGSKQTSILEYKEHLLEQHPELCHRCPRCGLLFALPQDVTRHTRDVECAKAGEEYAERTASNAGEWKCTNCSFTTDSQAEFLFHDALHAGSIAVNTDEAGYSKAPAKFRCPMCEKVFCKVTLRNHIRSHTGERPYRCTKCSLSFTRRSGLNVHRKECSSSSLTTWPKGAEAFGSRRRNHACSECNAAFFTNDAIENNEMNNEAAYEKADRMLDRQAPNCNEDCRNSILELDINNVTDRIIHCHREVYSNVVNDSVTTEDPLLNADMNNSSIVCFIKAESKCSRPKTQVTLVNGSLSGVSGAIGSGVFVITLTLVGLISFIIFQKKRNAKGSHMVSRSTSILTGWPDNPDHHRNPETSTLHALKQHTMRHAGKNYKCGLPGCPTILRTENELRFHRRLVHENSNADRPYRCNECPYSAKTRIQLRRHQTRHEIRTSEENPNQMNCPFSHCNFTTKITSHLRRHLRLHTGTKPYKCRHCSYASNNLENLRKHVLSTGFHPGKTIYECEVCTRDGSTDPYCTNFTKELRAHLLEAHPRDFPRPSDASDHVAKIFRTDGEPGSPTPNVNNPYEDSITGQRHDHDYKC